MPLPKNIQPNKWKGTECMEAFKESSPQLRIHCYKTAEPLLRNGTVEHVALFHYATKSAADFKHKMARGSGMSLRSKGYEYFNEILKCGPPLHVVHAFVVQFAMCSRGSLAAVHARCRLLAYNELEQQFMSICSKVFVDGDDTSSQQACDITVTAMRVAVRPMPCAEHVVLAQSEE